MNVSMHELALITATKCCVCKADLTDAESVSMGIGPICSQRYYNPLHEPTPEQVRTALGLMAVSNFPDHIESNFLALVNGSHANARKGSNLLIYWASAHYDDKDEVFRCASIIRALGYTVLADKLEIDRTVALIEEETDHLRVFFRDRSNVCRDIRRIPGARFLMRDDTTPLGDVVQVRDTRGAKKGWYVPSTRKDHLECVLSVHFHGQLVCGTQGIRLLPRRRPSDLLPFFQSQSQNRGTPQPSMLLDTATVKVWKKPPHIHVRTPYNGEFVEALKKRVGLNDRRWDPTGRMWVVAEHRWPVVQQLLQEFYGVGGVSEDSVL